MRKNSHFNFLSLLLFLAGRENDFFVLFCFKKRATVCNISCLISRIANTFPGTIITCCCIPLIAQQMFNSPVLKMFKPESVADEHGNA